MPPTPTAARARWVTVFAGLVAGALVAVVGFFVVGVVSDDSVEPVTTDFSLSDKDALAPGPVTLVSVRDVRQASSIPGLAAPTGDRYVSLVVALEGEDAVAQQWFALDDLSLALFAVDGAGEREALVPDATGQRKLDGIGGRVRGLDPYWITLQYAPPAGEVAGFDVEIEFGGEGYRFTVHEVGSA